MLYLFPTPLASESNYETPQYNSSIIEQCSHFFIEDLRTARRWIKKCLPQKDIDTCFFYEINEHTNPESIQTHLSILKQFDCVLMSDAGCPAVADPGMLLVALAHQHAIKVVPLVGPSSILLGLMASGLNGQNFSFLGYLPQKKEDKIQKIKRIGALAHEQTFSCIETPYSNGKTLELFLQYLPSHLRLCIACDLTHTTQEFIQTKTIQAWKKNPPQDLHKRPTIFFIGV